MGLFRKLKEAIDPINKMTPAQVVRSVPLIWIRVPMCIYAGYFDNKTTEGDIVDHDAIISAIAGTEVQVYGRDMKSVFDGETFETALQLYSGLKEGSEKEKIEDATLVLLIAEMVKGETNISAKLGTQSADLGFMKISLPIISQLMEAGYPPTEEILEEITSKSIEKSMSFTG